MSKIKDVMQRAKEVRDYYNFNYMDLLYSIKLKQRITSIPTDDVVMKLKQLPKTKAIINKLAYN